MTGEDNRAVVEWVKKRIVSEAETEERGFYARVAGMMGVKPASLSKALNQAKQGQGFKYENALTIAKKLWGLSPEQLVARATGRSVDEDRIPPELAAVLRNAEAEGAPYSQRVLEHAMREKNATGPARTETEWELILARVQRFLDGIDKAVPNRAAQDDKV